MPKLTDRKLALLFSIVVTGTLVLILANIANAYRDEGGYCTEPSFIDTAHAWNPGNGTGTAGADLESFTISSWDGCVYAFSYNPDNDTFINHWRYSTGSKKNNGWHTLDEDNQVLYFGSNNKTWHAVDPETGEAIWRCYGSKGNSKFIGRPLIHGNYVYMVGGGAIWAFDRVYDHGVAADPGYMECPGGHDGIHPPLRWHTLLHRTPWIRSNPFWFGDDPVETSVENLIGFGSSGSNQWNAGVLRISDMTYDGSFDGCTQDCEMTKFTSPTDCCGSLTEWNDPDNTVVLKDNKVDFGGEMCPGTYDFYGQTEDWVYKADMDQDLGGNSYPGIDWLESPLQTGRMYPKLNHNCTTVYYTSREEDGVGA